jgi:hypothetical protein
LIDSGIQHAGGHAFLLLFHHGVGLWFGRTSTATPRTIAV